MQSRPSDPMSVFDETLFYEDFDAERFLRSVAKLDASPKRLRRTTGWREQARAAAATVPVRVRRQ